MKISIITPSFNQGRFIEETIESILNQKYVDIEMIVVDGCSSDNTIEILKKYEGRIRWLSEKDNGQTDAINKGLKMANGDIVAYLNSDDYYTTGALSNVLAYFKENPDCKILTGDYIIVNEFGEVMHSPIRLYKHILRKINGISLLCFTNYISQPSTFWRRELLDEIGYFNEDLHYVMDYEYWMRVMKKYKLHVTSETLSVFRIHSQSKGGHLYKKQFDEELEVAKKYCNNKIILWLHALHNKLITTIYKIIK